MPLSPWDDRGFISLVWEQKNHWVFNMAISNSATLAEVKVHRQLHGSSSKSGGAWARSRSRHSAAWWRKVKEINTFQLRGLKCPWHWAAGYLRGQLLEVWPFSPVVEGEHFGANNFIGLEHGCLGKVKKSQGALITGLRRPEDYPSVHQSEYPTHSSMQTSNRFELLQKSTKPSTQNQKQNQKNCMILIMTDILLHVNKSQHSWGTLWELESIV